MADLLIIMLSKFFDRMANSTFPLGTFSSLIEFKESFGIITRNFLLGNHPTSGLIDFSIVGQCRCHIIGRKRTPTKSDIQACLEMLDQKLIEFCFKVSQAFSSFFGVWKDKVGVPSTDVEKISPCQLQLLQ